MPAVLEKCVKDVKAKGGKVNPWAICTSSLQRAGKLKKKSSRKNLGGE